MRITLRNLALAVGLAIAVQGCASVWYAIEATPERAADALADPVRRLHLTAQVGLSATAGAVTLGCSLVVPPPASFIACPIVGVAYYYVTYEYILEPWSKARVAAGKPSIVGPYWERGPQDNEVFIRP